MVNCQLRNVTRKWNKVTSMERTRHQIDSLVHLDVILLRVPYILALLTKVTQSAGAGGTGLVV